MIRGAYDTDPYRNTLTGWATSVHSSLRPTAAEWMFMKFDTGGSFNTIYEHVLILIKSDRNNRKFTYRPTSLPARIHRVNHKCLPDRKTLNRTWTVNETFHARTHFPPV